MPNYKRSYYGRTYFFTVVTHNRKPLFREATAVNYLRDAIHDVQSVRPFDVDAIVVLPDHIHCIWSLPEGDVDYSKRWGIIKAGFTKKAGRHTGWSTTLNASRSKRHEGEIWQRRFWELQIRDDRDYQAHCDYIHYNPVKHGLVKEPVAWRYSSFHRFAQDGFYAVNWGSQINITFASDVGNE
jgi:putative transposase